MKCMKNEKTIASVLVVAQQASYDMERVGLAYSLQHESTDGVKGGGDVGAVSLAHSLAMM